LRTVKRLRLEKGWSQKDLADKSGVGQDTISGIESGKHEPRPSTLRKLAEALDAEVVDFFSESEELTTRPKESWRSWEEFLEEKTGHAHLAGDRDEIADFLRGAESVEDHEERVRLLREEVFALDKEKKKSSAFTEMEIGGVPYMEIRKRHAFSILVRFGEGAITAEEAERELATA
jgi:transcriptional regulator with XRE-family HTH domain